MRTPHTRTTYTTYACHNIFFFSTLSISHPCITRGHGSNDNERTTMMMMMISNDDDEGGYGNGHVFFWL